MIRSDYAYEVTTYKGRNFIFIEDLNMGNRSVTNDIENVVADIAKRESINPRQYYIIYRDSEGNWDGWDDANQDFIGIGETQKYDAADALINRQSLPA